MIPYRCPCSATMPENVFVLSVLIRYDEIERWIEIFLFLSAAFRRRTTTVSSCWRLVKAPRNYFPSVKHGPVYSYEGELFARVNNERFMRNKVVFLACLPRGHPSVISRSLKAAFSTFAPFDVERKATAKSEISTLPNNLRREKNIPFNFWSRRNFPRDFGPPPTWPAPGLDEFMSHRTGLVFRTRLREPVARPR